MRYQSQCYEPLGGGTVAVMLLCNFLFVFDDILVDSAPLHSWVSAEALAAAAPLALPALAYKFLKRLPRRTVLAKLGVEKGARCSKRTISISQNRPDSRLQAHLGARTTLRQVLEETASTYCSPLAVLVRSTWHWPLRIAIDLCSQRQGSFVGPGRGRRMLGCLGVHNPGIVDLADVLLALGLVPQERDQEGSGATSHELWSA